MGDAIASGGRPESETDTPVNIGNGPYRDNGDGVAAATPPYPLRCPVGAEPLHCGSTAPPVLGRLRGQ
jgi:hypothetical protein